MTQLSNSTLSILNALKKDSIAEDPKIFQAVIVDAIKLAISRATPLEREKIMHLHL